MTTMKAAIGTLAMAICVANAQAAGLRPVTYDVQPQMTVDGGKVVSCGLRLVGVAEASDGDMLAVDFSLNVDATVGGLIKANVRLVNTVDRKLVVRKTFKISDVWAKVEGGSPIVGTKPIAAKTPGYVLKAIDVKDTLSTFLAIQVGKPISIGFTFSDGSDDVAVAGQAKASDADFTQLRDCLGGLFPANTKGK